jgi:2-polyprenyl-3-methyl-5-hydroxy-6-metoxy-1,4-benzoquinol methylase
MLKNIQAFYDRKYSEGTEVARTSKQYLIDCVPHSGKFEILDVGCGSGANSEALAARGHTLHGVDLSETAITRYRSRGFEGRVGDLESGLGYPDAMFDVVFCSEVIEHMTSPEVLAAEMCRVLKPGGLLVLSTPNSAFWLYRLLGIFGYTVSELQHPKHFQFFSRRSLTRLLISAGFQPKRILGRNMYLILPKLGQISDRIMPRLGFVREKRFRTGGYFWHISNKSRLLTGLLADTLICVMQKSSRSNSAEASALLMERHDDDELGRGGIRR